MTSDTPEPQPPDGPGAKAEPGSQVRAPRVLVSVDDFDDPAEWDVIVVENEAVDDDTARRIARQRSARERRTRSITLPSLDEQDVIKAFDTDRDAEDAEGVSVEAFAPPEPAPVRRRPVPDISALPALDPFAGLPEPDPEPDDAADEGPLAAEERAFTPDALAPIEDAAHRRPAPGAADQALGAEPPPPQGAGAPTGDRPAPATSTTERGDEAAAAAAVVGLAAGAADPEAARPLVDDPQDDFYDIGDAPEVTSAAASAPDPDPLGGRDQAWGTAPEGLDVERELVDDPRDDFYDVGPAAEDAEERARLAEDGPADAPPEGDAPVPLAPLTGVAEAAPAPGPDEDFQDEVEFDSSFPLGPDDLALEGELEPVDLDTLDYAAVFGPVQGEGPDPVHQPARRRVQPAYEDDLFLEDDDDGDRHVVVPARSGGRRRHLVALGIAAGVTIAIGVGSQIYDGDDTGLEAGDDPTTSTTRERVRATTPTTQSELTLPSLPADESATTVAAPTGSTPREGRATTTTRRRGGATPTTRRTATPPTAAPTTRATQPPPPPSTAPPTTSPPATEPPPTTAPPGP